MRTVRPTNCICCGATLTQLTGADAQVALLALLSVGVEPASSLALLLANLCPTHRGAHEESVAALGMVSP